jgi:hypothetical protein
MLEADPRHRFTPLRINAAGASQAGLVRFAPPTSRWHGFAGLVFTTPALLLELKSARSTEYILELAGSVREGTAPYTLSTIGWTFGRHAKLGRDLHLRLHGEQDDGGAIWTLTNGDGEALEALLTPPRKALP